MPTAEIPVRSGTDLNGVASLANLFLGKESKGSTSGSSQNTGGVTTTGSDTTSTNVSQDAVSAAIQSILEGSQGLAAVSSGQNKAGLYNSSTNRLLVNDLVARAAAQGASLNKTTTTTRNDVAADTRGTVTSGNTTNSVAPPIKPSAAIGGLGIMTALGQLSNTSAGKKVLESLGLSKASGVKTAGNSANSGGASSQGSVNDGTGNPDSAAVPNGSLASSNDQSIGSVGTSINNPSAYVAGDGTQDVGSLLTQSENGAGASFGTDLSFDQTNINGLDFGTDSVGNDTSGIGIDAAVGGPTDAGGDWGPDPSSIDFGDANTDFSDMFNFAEGGFVTPKGNHTLIMKETKSKKELAEKRGYAGGGYVNMAADKAFASGGDEPEKAPASDAGDNPAGIDFFKKTSSSPQVSEPTIPVSVHKSIIGKILSLTGNPGNVVKKPGYAEGGVVDLTNLGLRTKDNTPDPGSSAVTGDQLVSSILAKTARPTQASPTNSTTPKLSTAGASTRGTRATNTATVNPKEDEATSEGTPGTGVSGTVAENNAAIAGMASAIAGMAVGPIGSIAANIGMDALGIGHSSMNPVSNVISALTGMIGQDGMAAAAAAASAANTAPTASDDAAAVANSIANDNNTDPMDALIGMLSEPDATPVSEGDSGNDGTGAEGGGIGGGGNSAGSEGGGGGSDGGTASAARGGMIRGPGTATSDSIDAKLSDGEYVIKAAVVDHYGKDFFDRLNQSISAA